VGRLHRVGAKVGQDQRDAQLFDQVLARELPLSQRLRLMRTRVTAELALDRVDEGVGLMRQLLATKA